MAHRLGVRQAEHALHHPLVRKPNPQHKTVVAQLRGGQRLLGHGHGMTRIGGRHRRAEFNAGRLAPRHAQCRNRIDAPDMRHPERGEARGLGALGERHNAVNGNAAHAGAAHETKSHGEIPVG